MGILFSCCRKKRPDIEYKRVGEGSSPDLDLEGGGGGGGDGEDDWDDWDSRPSAQSNSRPPAGGCRTAAAQQAAPELEPEPEPEPEPDPFAEMGMAPVVTKTKRHQAQSVFAKPAAPSSSKFAMGIGELEIEDAGGSPGGGWGDEDLGDELGINARRQAVEERRQARRKQREGEATSKERRQHGLAATKVTE